MHAQRASDAATREDERFRPSDRVRRRFEYRRAQQVGQRVHTQSYVLLVAAPSDRDGERAGKLGITVTKKVAGAVGRNRIKRITREVFRRNRSLFPERCDVVAIAKRGAPQLDYAGAVREFEKAERAMRAACTRAHSGAETRGSRS